MKTMSIKMVTTMAGPEGSYQADQVRHDVPEDEYERLIEARAAIPYKEEPETADDKQPGKEDADGPGGGDGGDQKPATVPKRDFIKETDAYQAKHGEDALNELLDGKAPEEIKPGQRAGILSTIRDGETRDEFDAAVEEFAETFGEDILLTVLEDKQPEDFAAEDIPAAMAALHTYTEENKEEA